MLIYRGVGTAYPIYQVMFVLVIVYLSLYIRKLKITLIISERNVIIYKSMIRGGLGSYVCWDQDNVTKSVQCNELDQ